VKTLRTAAAAACLAAALAACAGGGYSVPEAKPLPNLPDTTAVQDFTGVVLAGVPGKTTTIPPALGPGGASLQGLVTGPEGPVPGAVVHLERIVDDGTAMADVVAGPDGIWKAENILGGRYRLRAYRPLDLAVVKPAVFFLGGTEKRTYDITLQRFTGLVAIASVAPNPPRVDESANLVVRIAQQSVDSGGVVRAVGVAGANAELVGSGQWRVESANPTVTDENGDAYWQVRCRSSGTQPLAVSVNAIDTLQLELPPCAEEVVAPPPDGGSTSTSFPFRRTTTTVRRTTTTR
jgi:hypothetical protein